jgi:TonB family protein
MSIGKLLLRPRKNGPLAALYRAESILNRLVQDDVAAYAPVVVTAVLLPQPPSRWRSFSVSSLMLCLFVFGAVAVPVLFPEKFEPVRRYLATAISEPTTSRPKLDLKKPVIGPRAVQPTAAPVETRETTPAPRLYVPSAAPAPAPIASRSMKPAVLVAEVSSPVSMPPALLNPVLAIPTLIKPRDDVHTGVFGSSDEARDGFSTNAVRRGFINAKFAEAGDSLIGGSRRTGVRGALADAPSSTSSAKPGQGPATALTTPIRILIKPTPAYTAEARRKNIEGDVLLQVIFRASGNVEVISVVRGLGFGLDESAEAAARQIQFQPAMRNGKSADFPAVVHISFQLAE